MSLNKTCKQCQTAFVVEDADLEFYKRLAPTFAGKTFEIPSPTLCPDCRRQRRVAGRNVTKLYRRKSDLSGKEIVSPYAPNASNKVYDNDEYYSDKWNPFDFGRDFDFSRPFFEQFNELYLDVPVSSRNVIFEENSEFTNNATALKDCYLLQNSKLSENSYYGLRINRSKDCVDNYICEKSENCYECVNIENCYGCQFCIDSVNCRDSILLDNCTGCKDCFSCANLNNKQYWINNKPGAKDDFEKKRDEFLNADLETRSSMIKVSRDFHKAQPKRFTHIYKSENVVGDYISNSKNLFKCFLMTDCENLRYCHNIVSGKDSIDYDIWGNRSENIIDCGEVGEDSRNVYFSRMIEQSHDIYYSVGLMSSHSHDCFGCAGLRQSEYCVLNKKYTKDEYEKLVAIIIEHMQKTGEWGEYFPIGHNPYGYNETIAYDFYPITKEAAKKIGAKWQDEDFTPKYEGSVYVPLPIEQYKNENNPSANEEIGKALAGVLKCKVTGKPFKLQPQELIFYIKNNIQIPNLHPDQRHTERFKLTNPLHVWHRQCDCVEVGHGHEGKCKVEFETTYAPDRPEKVYCESCYQKSVI